jgi:hypothetical protein
MKLIFAPYRRRRRKEISLKNFNSSGLQKKVEDEY